MKNDVSQGDDKRILITGGAGFIGSYLTDTLIERGRKVRILDNLSSGKLDFLQHHLANGNAQLVKGDVRNMRDVEVALRGVDEVFHLAAVISVPYSVMNPTITKDVNVRGTKNLLDASLGRDMKSFVFVSSCAVYGEAQYLPIDEVHNLNPMSPYAESKKKGEEFCQEYHEKHGLRLTVLRPFNAYGLRQAQNEYSGVITRFIRAVMAGSRPVIYGDGMQTRDFVHVKDVVQALVRSSNNDKAAGQTFNIGSGRAVTINELCTLILKQMRTELIPVHENPRQGDIKHSYANIEKARRILGYHPGVSLEEGLNSLIVEQGEKN
jgi:nucleoside-diphosphate-sugar epimerase